MAKSLFRPDSEVSKIYERHKRTVYRVCFAYMKNSADTEDAVQETFYHMMKSGKNFLSEEHEKAWLIRVATNICKNTFRSRWRKRESLESFENSQGVDNVEIDEIFSAVLSMPDKYKTVVYLYYYEGYNSREISEMLGKPKSTIRNYLHEARNSLREKLGGNFDEE
ncbi:MAG: ECF RNA polymerase sigma factor SigR [Firmicutes bacterium ADurb.Bin300]|nr:MAG: ECF RNA polymerase sigma factor SigR [Firmicutes bacterium ADurb.Bin300]HOD03164.1 RNA polymerase sigma factor [Clostridiales bacterium]